MPTITIRKHCKDCGQMRPFSKPGTSHLIHFVLSICTFGFWSPIWILCGLKSVFTPFRCPQCGKSKI